MDALTFVFFVALIRGSGMVATNMYCRPANNRCATPGHLNAKPRRECRKYKGSPSSGAYRVPACQIKKDLLGNPDAWGVY